MDSPENGSSDAGLGASETSEEVHAPTGALAEALGEVAGDLSEIREHVVEAHRGEAPTSTPASDASRVDRHGGVWDPEVHLDPPKLTKAGRWRRRPGFKKGTRGAGSENSPERPPGASTLDLPGSGGAGATPGPEGPDRAKEDAERVLAAKTCTGLVIQGGILLAGPEVGMPIKIQDQNTGALYDERANMEAAFYDYFKATGLSSPPPWAVLVMGCSAYGFRVMQTEPAQKKVASLWDRIKQRARDTWVWLKGYRSGAHVNSGNDGKRQNDPSQKAGRDLQGQGN